MIDDTKISVAKKMAKLEELTTWFDGDDFELETALDKYKEAKVLADEIEHDLVELKNMVTIVSQKFDESEE